MAEFRAEQRAQRIIFLPFIDAFGGAERLVLDLSRFLHERGTASTIACFRQTIDLPSYADWPLRVHQLLPTRNSVVEARALSRFLRTTRLAGGGHPLLFDLKSSFYSGIASSGPFFLHLTDPPSLLPADLSKHAPSARKRFQEFQNLPRAGVFRSSRAELAHCLNRRGVKRAARVIVMTERIRTEVQQLYGVDSLVIRPGVSANGFARNSLAAASKPLCMLSVSRLEPNKRVDWILRALETLNSTGSLKKTDWVFEVVGQGPAADSLKQLAKQLGLAEQVFFLGHISAEALAEAYSRANLFVMPAVQGYGLPALEALHRGIPTIVHKDSGVSEILGRTPWVQIIDGDGSGGSLATAIVSMRVQLETKRLLGSNMPHVPAVSEWANEVCSACGWLPSSMNQ